MKKADIQKALEKVSTTKAENIVAAGLVRNIQVFGDEVIVDARKNCNKLLPYRLPQLLSQ